MTVTLPQAGKSYECRYWDTTSSAWLTDGLETVLNPDNTSLVQCLTDHLTAFTLMAVDTPTTDVPTDLVTDSTTGW